jgi:hypothetical protein
MATTVDCVRIQFEETPRYENAPTSTPYRVSTVTRDMPVQSVRIVPAPEFLDRSDEVRGIEGGVPQLVNAFAPEGQISSRAYLDDLVFLLTAAGWTPTITAGNGSITDPDSVAIPTGATRYVFNKRGGVTAKSMQLLLNYVDEAVFLKGQGFGISQLSLNAEGLLTADMVGLVVLNTADPNITPSIAASSIPPIRRGDLTLTWLSNTGTTEDFSISISNPLDRFRTLGSGASFFPDRLEHGTERVRLTGSMPKSSLADADYDALVAGTTFAATARWKTTTNIGATSYPYTIWIEMPKCQYLGGDIDPLSNARRFGSSFDFWAAWDESGGYDARITIVCGVAAVETYA